MLDKLRKNRNWLYFILFTVLTIVIFSQFPNLTDLFYGKMIYPFFRSILNFLFRPFSMSLALLFISFMLYLLLKSLLKKNFIQFIKIVFLLIASFYWLWGFNYYRSPLSENLNLNFKEVDDSTRFALTNAIMDTCVSLSDQIGENDTHDYDETLYASCNSTFTAFPFIKGMPNNSVAFKPDALLLRIGIMGMYFPYTGQGQYDDALTLIDRPFTIAHEWSHAAGIAPEYEADFFAYLICIEARDPRIRYSAYMHLLTELMIYYKFTDKEIHDNLKVKVSNNMKKHLEDKRKLYEKYGSFMYEVSDEMIENYLKMHGQEGLSDYHRLSEYVFAYSSGQIDFPSKEKKND